MNKKNPENQETAQLTINALSKRKYWYRCDVEVCVLCGKETRFRERVYNENEKGVKWTEGACSVHFL